MATVDQISRLLKDALQPIEDRLKAVEDKLEGVEDKLEGVKSAVARESALSANSRLGPHDKLVKVPFPDGRLPEDAQWPLSIATLAVGGSELMPGTTRLSGWSKEKSLVLLRRYGGYDTDDEGQTPTKCAASSLRRRRVLAKTIGVGVHQLRTACDMSFLM